MSRVLIDDEDDDVLLLGATAVTVEDMTASSSTKKRSLEATRREEEEGTAAAVPVAQRPNCGSSTVTPNDDFAAPRLRTHGGNGIEKMKLLSCGMAKVAVEHNGASASGPKDAKLKRREAAAAATTTASAVAAPKPAAAPAALSMTPARGVPALVEVDEEERGTMASTPTGAKSAASATEPSPATPAARATPSSSASKSALARATPPKKAPVPLPKNQPTITSFFAKFAAKKKEGDEIVASSLAPQPSLASPGA